MIKGVERAEDNNDFYTASDGFVYFWPATSGGAYAAYTLRELADELDRRNEVWNKRIERDLS